MTLGAVNFEEPYGSFTLALRNDGTTATRIFKVDWDDLPAFLIELQGGYRNVPTKPWTEPARLPGFPYLYCQEIDVEGLEVAGKKDSLDGEYIDYPYAKVTARYEVLPLVAGETIADPAQILQESVRVTGEMLTMPEGSFLWESDDDPVKESPGKVMPTLELNITRQKVEELDRATLLAMVGKVNDAEWRGIAIGKALFLGADASRTTTTDGAENWEVTYSFLVRDISHNYFFRPDEGWEEVIQKGVAPDTGVYEEGTFTDLGI